MFKIFKRRDKMEELIAEQNSILLVIANELRGGRDMKTAARAVVRKQKPKPSRKSSTPAKKSNARHDTYKNLLFNDELKDLSKKVTGQKPIAFDPSGVYSSTRFKSGSKSAAYERLIWAVQKSGGSRLVRFSGVDVLGGAKERAKATAMLYQTASAMGVNASAVVSDEAVTHGDDVILISVA